MREFRKRRTVRAERYRSYSGILPAAFFFAALIALGAGWINYIFRPSQIGLGGLITASISAASIVYSLARARQSAKSQFTLTLLASRFSNGEYAENVQIVGAARADGTLTTETDIITLKTLPAPAGCEKPPYHAVIPLLNFWEHVCTAYVDDHIDRQVFEDSATDLIFDMVGRYPRIISDLRAIDSENFEHLCATWFVLSSDVRRRDLAGKLGRVPQRLCSDDEWRWQKIAAA
ncbi:MAG: hypothetical protein ABI898_10935 [Sphingomonadales bacterium]